MQSHAAASPQIECESAAAAIGKSAANHPRHAVIALGDDAASLRRVCHRLALMAPHPPHRVHLILRRPAPGAGVLLVPDIAWLKGAEAEQVIDSRLADVPQRHTHHLTNGEALIPTVSSLARRSHAGAIILPRPAVWAPLARIWWSRQARYLLEALPSSRLTRYPETHVLTVLHGLSLADGQVPAVREHSELDEHVGCPS